MSGHTFASGYTKDLTALGRPKALSNFSVNFPPLVWDPSERSRRCGIKPNAPADQLVGEGAYTLAVLVLATLASVAGLQLARLARELSSYQEMVLDKLEALQEKFGGSAILERINATGSP